MSVVRDILGVTAQTQSPMAAVMSSIGLASKPTTKKRKSFSSKLESKEVANLRDSEGLVKSPPATPTGGDSRGWKWRKFKNSAAASGDPLSHWDNRDDVHRDYTAVRCNIGVDMPDLALADDQVLIDIEKRHRVDRRALEEVWETLRVTELNFIVAADRLGKSPEELKGMYYSVFSAMYPNKKCKYSFSADVERKKLLEERAVSIATEGAERVTEMKKREKELIGEIKEIENRLKTVQQESAVLEKLVNPDQPPVATGKKANQPRLASSETKAPGAELVAKYVPGVALLSAFLAGTKYEPPTNTTALVNKVAVDFSSLTRVPVQCTSFNSKKINDFFAKLAELSETEKALNAFIRKREADIKAASKNS